MKYLWIILFCLSTSIAFAQEKVKEVGIRTDSSELKKAENLQSGNYKDVLTSFFQLAAKDLTGENKSFAFSSTLFALKAKANPDILSDMNFRRERFARNFQFGIKVNLDSGYAFKGFTGGLTYAIVNQRDRGFADFNKGNIKIKYSIDSISKEIHLLLVQKQIVFANEINSSKYSRLQRQVLADSLQKGIDHFMSTGSPEQFPSLFFDLNSSDLGRLVMLRELAKTNRKKAFEEIEKSWLFTIGLNGTTNKDNQVKSGSLNTVLLKGLTGAGRFELDIRGSLSYADTIAIIKYTQVKLKSAAGVNWKMLMSGDKSLLEFKTQLSYDRIWKDILSKEDRELFAVNGEFRLRITDQLWLPVLIKYDCLRNNFLGFLNVSFNFDGVK